MLRVHQRERVTEVNDGIGSSALKQTTSIRSHTFGWSFRWAVRRAGSHVATPLAHLPCMWAGVPRYLGLSQDGETEPGTWETWNGIRKESWGGRLQLVPAKWLNDI